MTMIMTNTLTRFRMFFGVVRPNRENFTHMETSPLQVKGCKFSSMLGTYGH